MHQILKAILTVYVLFICMRFVSMNDTELSSPLSTDTLSARNSTSDVNLTDVWSEYNHEHIAVQKWRKNDAHIRELCLKMYNKILPYVINSGKEFDLSPGCSRALMKTLVGLKQYKIWTFKMIDSSGKIPTGILNFDTRSIGNYDECLEVNVPGYFGGQYCNIDLFLPLPERERFAYPFVGLPEFENFSRSVSSDSVTAELLKKLHFAYYGFSSTAICVPSACSKEEIQELASKAAEKLEINYDIVIRSCETLQEKYEFSSTEIAIMTVLGILLFLEIAATVVDVFLKRMTEGENYQDTLSLSTKYLLCFSFYTNARRLVTPDTSIDTIKVFHGMRVFSVLWMILGHTYAYENYHITNLASNFIQYNQDISFLFVQQGYLVFDTFFFINAVVYSYTIMNLKDMNINYSLYILRRILRLIIPFTFVIACVFLIPYLGSGPVWKETIEQYLTGNCRSNWWYNVLFVNNFLRQDDMCLHWSWYVSVDIQLFLLSLPVLITIRRNPRLAFTMNFLILLGGFCISEVFRSYYGIAQVPIHAYGHNEDRNYLLEKEQCPTYEHTASCCIGLLVGYFLATRSFKMNIHWMVNIALWLSSIILVLAVLFSVYDWNQGHIPNIILCMLYKSTKQFWWSLALAWMTISCTTGNGGIVNDILAWPGFLTLARLTYMNYLIHPIIQYIYIGSTRTLIDLDHRSLAYVYVGHVVFSYMCSYVCTLLFESPFTALQNIIFSSSISDDVKIFRPLDGLRKKEGTEMTKERLIDEMNINGDYTSGNQDTKQNGYGSMSCQALPD